MDKEQPLPRAYRHLSLYAALLIAAFALLSGLQGQWLPALVALVLMLIAGAHYRLTRDHELVRGRPLVRLATLLMLVMSWAVLSGHLTVMLAWLFVLPLLVSMVWSLTPAAVLSTVFMVMIGIMSNQGALGAERHQLLPMLGLTIVLTGLFVFLREYKTAQLAPLRRTDALTLASTQDTLKHDLDKEISRSEREGTALSVVSLAMDVPDADQPTLPRADREAMIHRIGRLLHQRLRDFDSYYRLEGAGFFLLLPVTDTASAANLTETLRQEACKLMQSHDLPLTLSAGIAGLNVGDDSDSLRQKTRDALARARRRGGNQVESYSEASP
ncbi:MAG: diguanylate cyclase [Halomonadaceae bacterium]|nr:MAG: diguanylate cyclase [Halomonadaceae bacterium]